LFGLWWVASRILANPNLLPTPAQVVEVLWTDLSIYRYGFLSLGLIVLAFLFSLVVAIPVAALAEESDWWREGMSLLIGLLDPLPGIALLPLLLLWLGIGTKALFLLVLHAMFWPLYIALAKGFEAMPSIYRDVSVTFGLSRARQLWDVALPASLPHLMAGSRQAFARGWRAVIAAEMFFGAIGGSGGLGFYIVKKRAFFDVPALTAALLLIIVTGITVEKWLFTALEQKTIGRWYG
jgi:NitT/TauT family transport system permease protein